MAFNILAMDGGGILSLFSLYAIEQIQRKRPEFLAQVDAFAGTSAGGINALLMMTAADRASGLQQSISLWSQSPSAGRPLRSLFATISGWFSISSNAYLKDSLTPLLGTNTLGSLAAQGQYVVIPTFDLMGEAKGGVPTWKPKVFNNFGGKGEPDLGQSALDVALRTSAGPIFFPIYQGFVDGGLYANNPSMCALAQALSTPLGGKGEPMRPTEIRLLSVGTGLTGSGLNVENAPWGWKQWLLDLRRPFALVEAFFESGMMAVDFQCKSILGENFMRLNPPMKLGGELLDFDLEDSTMPPEGTGKVIKERLRTIATGGGTGNPPWLTGTLAWLDSVGWFEPEVKAPPKRARRASK